MKLLILNTKKKLLFISYVFTVSSTDLHKCDIKHTLKTLMCNKQEKKNRCQ